MLFGRVTLTKGLKMGWSAIIAAILSIVGPFLVDWLKKCGEERAKRSADRLPAFESYSSPGAARDALFDAMIDDLPRWARARKALLRRLKSVAMKEGVTGAGVVTLDPADAAELADLGGLASEE